jgi:hypothetical protein
MLAEWAGVARRSPTQEAKRRKEPVVFDNLGEAKTKRGLKLSFGPRFLLVRSCCPTAFRAGADVQR